MSEKASAGWYPAQDGTERYWDGEVWSEHLRPSEEKSVISSATPSKKDGMFARRRQAKDAETAQQEGAAREAGSLVTSGVFGTSTIEIYAGGYVRVASGERADLLGRTHPGKAMSPGAAVSIKKSTPFERLHSIKFTRPDQQDQSSSLEGSVGPAVANVLRGGKNIIRASAPGLAAAGIAHIASTGGRTSFLTISTDRQIHQLTNQGHNGIVKTVNKAHNEIGAALEFAGNATLGATQTPDPKSVTGTQTDSAFSTVAPPSRAASPTISERVRELADLHRDGILSDEEFSAAKAKVLDQL
ncbi:DUF2510 domain-containing protein [Aeromicrobium sp. Root472D3]|uniref:DUF2510 domain-containing protein n=1 Tax=Aeromicrobium sp. Root472D3 TaxID=1736540 RepID=UPI00138F89AD|nr:DUF2510 domain-containing protein [Aeromicrobium sp. Root472D3]